MDIFDRMNIDHAKRIMGTRDAASAVADGIRQFIKTGGLYRSPTVRIRKALPEGRHMVAHGWAVDVKKIATMGDYARICEELRRLATQYPAGTGV